jgi:hypothetical protein
MNERIRQLAEQAGFKYIKDEGIGWAGNYNASLPKFAQLIVRDCMDVVDGYTKGRTFETHYDAVAQIEALFGIKHNGVEE